MQLEFATTRPTHQPLAPDKPAPTNLEGVNWNYYDYSGPSVVENLQSAARLSDLFSLVLNDARHRLDSSENELREAARKGPGAHRRAANDCLASGEAEGQ